MRIVTGRTACRQSKHSFRFCSVQPRTTRMPSHLRVLGVMMCGVFVRHIRGHFMPRTHVPRVHAEHRRHRHLSPSGHGHQQRRRDCLPRHNCSESGINNDRGQAIEVTPRCAPATPKVKVRLGVSNQALQRGPQILKPKPVPACPQLPRLDSLTGEE